MEYCWIVVQVSSGLALYKNYTEMFYIVEKKQSLIFSLLISKRTRTGLLTLVINVVKPSSWGNQSLNLN